MDSMTIQSATTVGRPRDQQAKHEVDGAANTGPERALQDEMGPARESAPTESAAVANDEALLRATEELERRLAAIERHQLDIRYSEEDQRYVVRVLDRESGDVVREIPPERLLEASRQLNELRGLLFDERS